MNPRLVVPTLLLIYTVLTVAAMALVDPTADETKYLNAGRVILDAGWDHELTRQHPPLAYYGNQLFSEDFPRGGVPREKMTAEFMFWGRLGLLPFGWLAAALVFLLARGAYGTNGGMFALCCFCLNPLMIGYSALLVVDMTYLAGTLLAVHQLWRYWLRPSRGRAVALGLGLGLALGTKYLTLLITPVLLLSAAIRMRRVGPGLATLVGIGCIALLTLHACYGFCAGLAPHDSGSYQSSLVTSLVQMPGIGWLLTLFPAPFMLGADAQLAVNDTFPTAFLNGHFAPTHWTYYLWCFLLKTPEWTILLGTWLLLRKFPAWLRGRGSEQERALALACIPSALVLIVYLSLFARVQIGIRYMLPIYGMLFVLLGASLRESWLRRLSTRHLYALGILWLGLQTWDLGSQWPNLIAYFNTASGGQAEGYRHFRDSNCDWDQLNSKGRRILRKSEGADLEFIGQGQGPRFGRLAIYLNHLVSRDPEDPTKSRHWLEVFEPVRHIGAAWWVFESQPREWEAAPALTTDPRMRTDLAIAYLGEGRLEDASRHLMSLEKDRTAPLLDLLDLLRNARQTEPSNQETLAIAQHWMAVGRFDLAAKRLLEREIPGTLALLAKALAYSGRSQEAITRLRGSSSKSTEEILLLATLYQRASRYRDAIALLEQHMAGFSAAQMRLAEPLLASARSMAEFRDSIR